MSGGPRAPTTRGHHGLNLRNVRDVGPDDDRATAETADFVGHAFGSHRVVQEVDADIGALARQRDGDRATDTLLGARDERHRA